MSTLVTVAIAAAAVVLLSHRPSPRSNLPAQAPSAIADFAVLRRAQSVADQVPARVLQKVDAGGVIRVMPQLTRLIATIGRSKVYLVVGSAEHRNAGSEPRWSTRSGELVGALAVTGGSESSVTAAPASQLADAVDMSYVAALPRPNSLATSGLVAIAPNGVAHVADVVTDRFGRVLRRVSAPVVNNAAVIPFKGAAQSLRVPARDAPVSEKVIWYAQDGTVIPTSNTALTRATASETDATRRQLLREAQHQEYRAPAAFLAQFPVSAIHSRIGIHASSGLTISQPAVDSIPLGVLQMVGSDIDLTSVREVTKGTADMWVSASPSGICVTVLTPSPGGGAPISGGNCGGQGAGQSSTNPNGTVIYGVVPATTTTVRIQTGPQSYREVRPEDGVYIALTRFRYG
jgi:hypothetical protein